MKPKYMPLPPRPMDRARVGRDDPRLDAETHSTATILNVLRDPKYRIAMFESSDVLLICDERRPMNWQRPDGDKVILAILWDPAGYCPEEVV